MEKIGITLNNASLLLQQGKIDEAKIIFEETFKLLDKNKVIDGTEPLGNYICCLLGLGEIYMKNNNLEKSLQYYLEGNELTEGKDFNIVFNLGVVYSNLNDDTNSKKFLKIAGKLEPTNQNLLNFLAILDNQSGNTENNVNSPEMEDVTVNTSFKDKIQDMMKKINN